jgi:hypothetical protein
MKNFLLSLLIIFATIHTGFAQNSCPTPITPNVTIQNNVAVVTWNSIVSSSNSFTIAYKKTTDSLWTTSNVNGFAFTIGNLLNCTHYQAKVRLNCVNNTTSDYTAPINFTTTGCDPCNLQLPITYKITNDSVVTFTLSGNLTTTLYTINYRVQGTNTWSIASGIPTPTFQVVLKKCTKYEFIFSAICNNDVKTTNLVVETNGCVVSCLKPIVTATPGNTNVTLNFAVPSPITTVINYIVKYRKVGDSTFTTLNNIKGNTFNLNGGLLPCTKYEIQVAQICSNNTISDFTILYITTEGCSNTCIKPIVTTSIGDNAITLAFLSPNTLNPTYIINYKKVGDPTFTTINHSGTNPLVYLNGLTPCTKYEIKVTQICSNGTISDPTVLTVETTGCINCALDGFNYTLTNDIVAVISWQAPANTPVKLEYRKYTDNTYTIIGNIYSPYTINLQKCTKYIFRATLLCNGQVIVKELVFSTTGCVAACPKPVGISVSIDTTTATVLWTTSTPSSNYSQILYKKATDSTWTTVWTQGGFTKILNNLMPCTKYNVKVAVICTTSVSTTYSDFAEISFTTLGCNNNCTKPAGISVSMNVNNAIVVWNPVAGSTNYKLLYRKVTDSLFTTITTATSPFTLNNLMPCTKYIVKVAALCSNNTYTDYTEIAFTTLGCPLPCEQPKNLVARYNAIDKTITLTWVGNAPKYFIQYQTGNTSVNDSTTLGKYVIKNVKPCSTYVIIVKSLCPTSSGVIVGLKTTIKIPCKSNCTPPAVSNYSVNSNGVTFSWSFNGSISYTIELRRDGNTTWQVINTTNNSYTFTNLDSCQTYFVRLRSTCDSVTSSAYSATYSFRTGGTCFTGGTKSSTSLVLKTYPNPAVDMVNLNFELTTTSDLIAEFYSGTGILLKTTKLGSYIPGTYNEVIDDIEDLVQGINLVIIKNSENQILQSKTLLKQ